MAVRYITVPVCVVVDHDGGWGVGASRAAASVDYTTRTRRDLEDSDGYRITWVQAHLPVPETIKLSVQVPTDEKETSLRVL